jgi:putative Holliday junction resolvase
MKVLGFDYGERDIGVAVADDEFGVAIPRAVIQNSGKKALKKAIAAIITETGAKRAVVGLPLSFQMKETAYAKKARAFGQWLREEFEIPVDFENEVLSSVQVKRLRPGRSKSVSHAAAAALILQSWLDARGEKIGTRK